MPRLILNQKVKVNGKSYPVNAKGVTDPVPVEAKDVDFFENNDMIVDVIDEKGNKLYLDERDKTIEYLKNELKKVRAQLAKKDEIITNLQVQIEESKTIDSSKENAESDTCESNNSDNDNKELEGEPVDEKTVDELYAIAGDLEIEGRSKLRNDKKELLKAVKKALAEKAGE